MGCPHTAATRDGSRSGSKEMVAQITAEYTVSNNIRAGSPDLLGVNALCITLTLRGSAISILVPGLHHPPRGG